MIYLLHAVHNQRLREQNPLFLLRISILSTGSLLLSWPCFPPDNKRTTQREHYSNMTWKATKRQDRKKGISISTSTQCTQHEEGMQSHNWLNRGWQEELEMELQCHGQSTCTIKNIENWHEWMILFLLSSMNPSNFSLYFCSFKVKIFNIFWNYFKNKK